MLMVTGVGVAMFCGVVILFGDMKGDRYHRKCVDWIRNHSR